MLLKMFLLGFIGLFRLLVSKLHSLMPWRVIDSKCYAENN